MSAKWHVRRLKLSQIGTAELASWQDLAVSAADEANVFLEPWFLHTALAQFDPRRCPAAGCRGRQGALAWHDGRRA